MSLELLRDSNIRRQAAWPGGDHIDMPFRAIELAGEAGEAMNKIKKYLRVMRGIQGKSTDTLDSAVLKGQIAEELADIVICTDLLCMELNIDLAGAVPAKFNKTSDKIGVNVRFST